MKESNIKTYDELPLFLNAIHVANALGISKTTAYTLMTSDTFPSVRIGERVIVEREKFKEWLDSEAERKSEL